MFGYPGLKPAGWDKSSRRDFFSSLLEAGRLKTPTSPPPAFCRMSSSGLRRCRRRFVFRNTGVHPDGVRAAADADGPVDKDFPGGVADDYGIVPSTGAAGMLGARDEPIALRKSPRVGRAILHQLTRLVGRMDAWESPFRLGDVDFAAHRG